MCEGEWGLTIHACKEKMLSIFCDVSKVVVMVI